MTVNFKLIGERVKKRRRELGISQLELAEQSNISEPYVSYIETGKKQVGLVTLIQIAEALEVNVDYLLTGNSSLSASNNEIAELLTDCSMLEKRILIEVSKSIKKIVKENLDLYLEDEYYNRF